MKKLGYILAFLLDIAALAGAWAVHYFTVRKMGMIRYVSYKNRCWERDYPMEALTLAAVFAVVLATIVVLVLSLKKWQKLTGLAKMMNMLMVCFTGLYAGYTLASSAETMTDYYFISLLFLVAAAVQITGTAVAAAAGGGKKHEHKKI